MADPPSATPSTTTVLFAVVALAAATVAHCGARAELDAPASVAPAPNPGLEPGRAPVSAASASEQLAAPAPPAGDPVPAGNPPSSDEAGAPGPATAEGRRYSVAAVGDSLTDAKAGGGKFLDYLRERCPESEFSNFGRGGDMVNQMRRRFGPQVLGSGKAFTHLLVWGGVNDLYSDLTAGRTPAKIARDLTGMYDQARARGWQVVAINVAPWGGFRRYWTPRRGKRTLELNDWIEQQRIAGRVDHVVDAYSLLSCGPPERLCPEYEIGFRDGLHLGPRGHEVIGKALYEDVFADCR